MSERESIVILERLIQIIGLSFAYIYLVAKLIGQENKNDWFKKRTRSSFFTRRGFMGDYINFGYPVSWQGILVFLVIYGVIFTFGYWYLFMLPLIK